MFFSCTCYNTKKCPLGEEQSKWHTRTPTHGLASTLRMLTAISPIGEVHSKVFDSGPHFKTLNPFQAKICDFTPNPKADIPFQIYKLATRNGFHFRESLRRAVNVDAEKKSVLCGQNTQRQAGVKNMLYFCSNWSNSSPIFGSKQLKNHTLWGCISQGGGVAPR